MTKKDKTELKKKKKNWVRITATSEFKNCEIGETFVDSPEKIIGRSVSINLMSLTRDMKKQNINIKFRIKEIKNSVGETELVGYSMIPAHIKRVTKRIKGKIEDSFVCGTIDGFKVRIKPLIITKVKPHRSDLGILRRAINSFIIEYCKKDSYINLMKSIVSGNLQKEIKFDTKKIFPINLCLIKSCEIVKN